MSSCSTSGSVSAAIGNCLQTGDEPSQCKLLRCWGLMISTTQCTVGSWLWKEYWASKLMGSLASTVHQLLLKLFLLCHI